MLNYHDSGYTNSSLHLQSSRAQELAQPRLVAFSEKLWQLATETVQFYLCNRYIGFLNCRWWWLSARKHVQI